jgi:1,4-dihydroxy-2-naphthoate octaprenyltransferase
MQFLRNVLLRQLSAENGRSCWTIVFTLHVLFVLALLILLLAQVMTWKALLVLPPAGLCIAGAVYSVKRIRHHERQGNLARVSVLRLLVNVAMVVALMWVLNRVRN